jgi:phosphoribosylglycinamide formyltransferase 1
VSLQVAVLASGAGTNLQAILDTVHGRDDVEVVAVASDKADAKALERARNAGVETKLFPASAFEAREARDAAMGDWLAERDVGLVVLAGYMQLLSPGFISRFENRIVNVHPALLPSFPGLDAVGQALAHGVRVTGVTVHFVDDGVDTGPIVAQAVVRVEDDDTSDSLHERIKVAERALLVDTVGAMARRGFTIEDRKVRLG